MANAPEKSGLKQDELKEPKRKNDQTLN